MLHVKILINTNKRQKTYLPLQTVLNTSQMTRIFKVRAADENLFHLKTQSIGNKWFFMMIKIKNFNDGITRFEIHVRLNKSLLKIDTVNRNST